MKFTFWLLLLSSVFFKCKTHYSIQHTYTIYYNEIIYDKLFASKKKSSILNIYNFNQQGHLSVIEFKAQLCVYFCLKKKSQIILELPPNLKIIISTKFYAIRLFFYILEMYDMHSKINHKFNNV